MICHEFSQISQYHNTIILLMDGFIIMLSEFCGYLSALNSKYYIKVTKDYMGYIKFFLICMYVDLL